MYMRCKIDMILQIYRLFTSCTTPRVAMTQTRLANGGIHKPYLSGYATAHCAVCAAIAIFHQERCPCGSIRLQTMPEFNLDSSVAIYTCIVPSLINLSATALFGLPIIKALRSTQVSTAATKAPVSVKSLEKCKENKSLILGACLGIAKI
uniref:Uncharacterized protein n=1 Tax=Glossina austeni TaxID=7395 RepID=A0A1A9URY1_GLOAU